MTAHEGGLRCWYVRSAYQKYIYTHAWSAILIEPQLNLTRHLTSPHPSIYLRHGPKDAIRCVRPLLLFVHSLSWLWALVRLGNSGLKVSRIILGCLTYGSKDWIPWVLPEEEAIKHIKFAYVPRTLRVFSAILPFVLLRSLGGTMAKPPLTRQTYVDSYQSNGGL